MGNIVLIPQTQIVKMVRSLPEPLGSDAGDQQRGLESFTEALILTPTKHQEKVPVEAPLGPCAVVGFNVLRIDAGDV